MSDKDEEKEVLKPGLFTKYAADCLKSIRKLSDDEGARAFLEDALMRGSAIRLRNVFTGIEDQKLGSAVFPDVYDDTLRSRDVLGRFDDGDIHVVYFDYYKFLWLFSYGDHAHEIADVQAWMDIPKDSKEDEEDDD